MSTLRQIVDGTGISIHSDSDDKDDSLVHHLKKAAVGKVKYDVARAKLQSKLAPMQKVLELAQQMHGPAGPNPQDASDPFQNPYQQEGQGGPGGVGQGMENQDDLARTGQMKKPSPGGVDNYLSKGANGAQPGKPTDGAGDGNKRLQTPDQRAAQGKPQQRSASGNKPPGKQTQPTEGKPVKKGKKIKLEISDDSLKAFGTSEGTKKSWDTRGRGKNAAPGIHEQLNNAGFHHVEDTGDKSRYQHPDYAGSVITRGTQWMHVAPGQDKPAHGVGSIALGAHLGSKSFKNQYGKFMASSHRHRGLDAAMTTLRGHKVATTGDYHDDAGQSMPTVAVGLSAKAKKFKSKLKATGFAKSHNDGKFAREW